PAKSTPADVPSEKVPSLRLPRKKPRDSATKSAISGCRRSSAVTAAIGPPCKGRCPAYPQCSRQCPEACGITFPRRNSMRGREGEIGRGLHAEADGGECRVFPSS